MQNISVYLKQKKRVQNFTLVSLFIQLTTFLANA